MGLLLVRLRQLWRAHPVDFSAANSWLLLLAAVASLTAVVGYGLVWPVILRRLGTRPPPDAIGIFLQSQLGKYVPGSVWQYAGRIGLARDRGIPIRTTVLSLAIEVGASTLAAAVLGLLVLPAALALPLALGVLVLITLSASSRQAQRLFSLAVRLASRVVRLPVPDLQLMYRALPRVTVLYIPVWVGYGLAFWLTGRALFAVSTGDVVFFTAAFALGWLVGMAAIFAPSGLGIREAVLVALLAPRIGQSEAIVLAATSRLLLTAADLVGGGAALLLPRLGRGMPTAALNEVDDEQ